ncbi:hypothetical protein Tco_0337456 [Tanacetum coccineum]
MEQEDLQQAALDEALVPIADQVKIGSCNMRTDPTNSQKEATYQVSLDIIKQYSCYNAFLRTTDVPQIYMQQSWYTIAKNEKSRPFNEHEKHLDLYNALICSIHLDEAIAKGEIAPTKVLKKRHHDDKEEDHPAGKTPSKPLTIDKSVNAEETVHEVAIKADETIEVEDDVVNVEEQPQDDAAPKQDNSIWFKQDARPETPDPEWHKVPNADDAPEHTCFHELVNADKNPLTFDDLMGSTVDFTKFTMHHFKKDKITKSNLEGPAYNLLKGTYRNNIELEYNLEQCCLALLDKLDWANLEGDTHPFDLSKPLPLQDYQVFIKISVDKQFGYGYFQNIFVQRADQKEYTFREADFSRLHLNDIEDMFLLYVQHKIHNLTDDDIVDLMIALHMFTQSIDIKRRVEDVQLGVEKKDPKQTDEIVQMIDNLLLEIQIMRSLECFVGRRTVKTDYRLLMRTV